MTDVIFLGGKVTLKPGDCLETLKTLPDCSIDACVTDPPYHLTSIVKRFGGANAAPAKHGTDGAFARASRGFMGRVWDGGDIAFRVELWAEVYRVLKPGGHVAAFSATRTYHRMACAIEDAGFEIRDQLAWCYGSGFPKSHDVSKAIDKAAGAERAKVRDYNPRNPKVTGGGKDGTEGETRPWIEAAMERGYHEKDGNDPATGAAREWQGWGTALKPSWEPICLGRKPLIGTVAENVLRHGTGALNIDGCRVPTDEVAEIGKPSWGGPMKRLSAAPGQQGKLVPRTQPHNSGRWPANVVHDGSDEVVGAFPGARSSGGGGRSTGARGGKGQIWGSAGIGADTSDTQYGDSGSAARFFYTAKADKQDRMGSKHPTVKPVDLMQWLCRLITPPGGTVLDPFAGSGSTGEAAWREGFNAVLCEREEEYQADIAERLRLASAGPMERKARAIKQVDTIGPLFGDNDNNPAGGGRQIYGKFADQSPDYRANRSQVVR